MSKQRIIFERRQSREASMPMAMAMFASIASAKKLLGNAFALRDILIVRNGRAYIWREVSKHPLQTAARPATWLHSAKAHRARIIRGMREYRVAVHALQKIVAQKVPKTPARLLAQIEDIVQVFIQGESRMLAGVWMYKWNDFLEKNGRRGLYPRRYLARVFHLRTKDRLFEDACAAIDARLAILAQRLHITPAVVRLSSVEELRMMVKSGSASGVSSTMQKRKRGYAVLDGAIVTLQGLKHHARKNGYVFLDDALQEERGVVRGTPGFLGKTSGRAVILLTPKNFTMVKKDAILVTVMTTPSYVPLFSRLRGVITDEGGITCHAAVISREYAIPCLVGTKNATKTFKTGDTIFLDATRGIAKKLSRSVS